ncbi:MULTISPECIES: LysE family translocator [unclassified Maridesulfovibrio]|uniref:LysE family translocator n=1 Tax=unclassified Maridesulfovibrio TaxID=2794999 RepID=UPI003B4253BA
MTFFESNMFVVGIVTVLAVISPGPDFAVIVRNGLRYGRKMGLATAFGIAGGVVVHVTYTLLGLSYLVAEFSWILEVVRYIGAAYLIWLGVSAFIPSGKDADIECNEEAVPVGFWSAFRNGFLCNALNPKTMMFFVALFTQVISPETSMMTKVGIGVYISLTHLVWFSFVVFVLTNPRTVRIFGQWRKTIENVVGCCLLGLGVKLALDA